MVLDQVSVSMKSINNSFAHAARSVASKYFDIPKPVDQFYIGRAAEAEKLKDWLLPVGFHRQSREAQKTCIKQKRFVIYGVGGSGKTQFCCKFAEDNRDQ